MFLEYIDLFFVVGGLAVVVAGHVFWLCAQERQWRKHAGMAVGARWECLLTLCAGQDDGRKAPV